MRRWTRSLSGISTLVWFGTVSVVPMVAEEPVVPVYHEPHHRQVFQYGSTRILDVQVPPGDTSWYHTHDSPILYVTLSAGQIRTQNLGGGFRAMKELRLCPAHFLLGSDGLSFCS